MLKRSEVVALSKSALRRVAAGKAGVVPANPKHGAKLATLKRAKKSQRADEERASHRQVKA